MKKQLARPMIVGGIIGGVVIGTLAVVLTLILTKSPVDPTTPTSSQSISGKIICAPKKPGNAVTTDCTYGLQTDAGKKYLLYAAKFPDDVSIQRYPTGTSVTVTGITSSDKQPVYDVDGTIMATDVRAR